MLSRFFNWIRSVIMHRSLDREMRDEMEAHLERAAERFGARGMSSREARHAALREFGNLEYIKELGREARGLSWISSVRGDVRHAVRVLMRAPGFALAVASTLGLGIAANAAIFSIVNGLVFRSPSEIVDPDRLVQIARSYDSAPRWDNWSWLALRLIEEESDVCAGVASFVAQDRVLGRGAETERIPGQFVSGTFFDVLGVRPFLGRLIQPADDVEPGGHAVIVLSYELWRARFGSDAGVLGTTVSVGARPYEIIGVAPPAFTGPESIGVPPAAWIPTMQVPPFYGELPFDQWGTSWLRAVGRLAVGVSIEEARASMDVVTTRLREVEDVSEDIRILLAEGVGLTPEQRSGTHRVSLLLLGIVALVLLLTCTNVANLFLAQAESRTSEFGVRRALGAGSGRLARQLITESLLLALLAIMIAAPIVAATGRVLPLVIPYSTAVSLAPDLRVFAFLACVGLLAGLLFGTAPAWANARIGVSDALREGRPTGTRTKVRLRDALVVAQLAISLGLVAGTALLGRSILNARAASPGFDPVGLIAGFADLQSTGRYDEESGREFFGRLLSVAESIPGVTSATLANQAPIVGGHSRATVRPVDREDLSYEAERVLVGPRYFETMRIPVVRGRALRGLSDEPDPVVVVNQALARLFWPGENPVGRVVTGGGGTWTVVGESRDVQMRSLRETANPAVYYPLAHTYSDLIVLHARTDGSTGFVASSLREAVAQVDAELPVAEIVDLRDGLGSSMGETRTLALLVALFATLALILASVGLYGVMSFAVAQRSREMGIRRALGAEPTAVVRLVLARGMRLAAFGTAAGLGVSYVVGIAFRGLLFEVPPNDPLTLGAAALLLVAVSVLAAWIPSRRASMVDAAVVLRE